MGGSHADAATFAVSTLNDSGPGSLRQAVLDANTTPGLDRIVFGPTVLGTIALTSGQLDVTDALQIEGPGVDALAIDADGNSRIFETALEIPVAISDLTLRRGKGNDGGGIYSESYLTLTNCTLTGNRAGGLGGAIYTFRASRLVNCALLGNRSDESGGGIYAIGPLTLTGCTLSDNSGTHGGGIKGVIGPLTLTDCTLANKTARGGGGFITLEGGGAIANSGKMTLTRCMLSGNRANDPGGAVVHSDLRESAQLTDCTLSGNSSDDTGGGIHNYSTMTLTGTTLSGNTADEGGGIFGWPQASAALSRCTLTANRAELGGGRLQQWQPDAGGYHALLRQGRIRRWNLQPRHAGADRVRPDEQQRRRKRRRRFLGGGSVTLTSSALSGNKALDQFGGGGGILNLSEMTVTHCTLSEGSASSGGGIWNEGNLTLVFTALTGNNAYGSNGGGILHRRGTCGSSGARSPIIPLTSRAGASATAAV